MKIKNTILALFCMLTLVNNAQNIKIKNLKLNNKLDHFSVLVNNGNLYFTHNLKDKRQRPIKDRYNSFLYTVYKGEISSNGEIKSLGRIKKTKYGKFNMSSPTISKDGKYMYFTSNNTNVGENRFAKVKTFNLQIQRAEYVEGKGWTNFTKLPFCNIDRNYGQPALSPDGKTLYFVANLKGTKGKTDLFKVSVTDHKTYGKPEKLSEKINSPRTEIFPYVSDDNKLYFSSNRRGGKGGYDIYMYDLDTEDETEIPIGLPSPINTIGEEFSFFLNEDGTSGYITSRRSRGKGSDDLYYFTGLFLNKF